MTIFKETLESEYVTTAEAKELLAEIEQERALDEDREMRYELARAIDHVNRFAAMDAEDGRALVEELLELEKLDEKTAHKIADVLPQDRDEVRSVFAQERYALDGDELDEVLNVVAKYA
jgi:DNA-directed RNA polymerase subunit F